MTTQLSVRAAAYRPVTARPVAAVSPHCHPGCYPGRAQEPHYWGHFFGAAAVALLSRSSSSASDNNDGYQKL